MFNCQWCKGRKNPPQTRQEAVEFECHRWAHTGRWASQEQAIAVGQRKALEYYEKHWERYLKEIEKIKKDDNQTSLF